MIAWKLIKGQVDIVPGRGGNDVAVSARTIIPLHTDNTGVQVAAVFRQIISQRLAGQLAATGREILQVIIPGGERSLTGSQLQSMSEGLQAGQVSAFTFSPSRHDGPGTEVYGRPPGILSAQLSYPAAAPPAVFFPGADFPGTYSFRSYPQNLWITVAPLLREKALLTA